MMMTTLTATVPEFLTPTLKSTTRYFNFHGEVSVSVYQFGRRRFHNPSRVFAVSDINKLVTEFDPNIRLERASTPPSSWYTDPQFYSFELDRVFYGGWQAVGYSDQIKESRDFFTGRLGDVEFVVCRDDNGKIHAFHNVCSHHASILASGNGKKSCFVCPYHGWTYSLSGSLVKATRMTGIENFALNEMGLKPLKVAVWGPFVLLKVTQDTSRDGEVETDGLVASEWLGTSVGRLSQGGVDSPLSFICRREYTIDCNWKVFCDNYLDGGYHVPYAHKGLMSGLDLETYSTTIFEKVSIQECGGGSKVGEDGFDRLGSQALYAFVYPNFMINRYGPWMDTNLVLPLGPRKCKVVFDYFLDPSLKDDEAFIKRSLEESERVQIEDVVLCESVQRGLESQAYDKGRYALVEKPMHHFHCLLHHNLKL
ncbi:Aromatic-ring-hydroxylating dioxygenase alpha subunit C-terminal domain [Arabidopsis suecica]|uniref:Choline monooxygenase, chloroplastic n=1 Tax=Arabidopsis suecica TaxID=45249 RepID=A0A8T1YI04_ARASU|nr:Aromatic-ring-hydroxylating dioxygenase alpha subunit C-terminal domain [Arabidopsis suecica]